MADKGPGSVEPRADAALTLRPWLARDLLEPWNVASQRVLERAAFEREGLLRGYARWGDEPRRDVYLYARLA